MKKGICPSCGSHDVWMKHPMGAENETMRVWFFTSALLIFYCCLSCGLVQSFISDDDMQDADKLNAIRKHSTKV